MSESVPVHRPPPPDDAEKRRIKDAVDAGVPIKWLRKRFRHGEKYVKRPRK